MNLPNYDSWLVEPFERAAEEGERFLEWAEYMGIDQDDNEAMIQAESDYNDYLFDCEEQRRIDEYEDAMERRYEEAEERFEMNMLYGDDY